MAPEFTPEVVAVAGHSLPSGTRIIVALDQSIDGRTWRAGQRYTATLAEPLLDGEGSMLLPAGARFSGLVTGIHAPRDANDQGAVRLSVDRISVSGRTDLVHAEIVATSAPSATLVGGRYAPPEVPPGGIPGALLGGGQAVLALQEIGQGPGAVFSLGRTNVPPVLPAGTKLVVQLTEPLPLPARLAVSRPVTPPPGDRPATDAGPGSG